MFDAYTNGNHYYIQHVDTVDKIGEDEGEVRWQTVSSRAPLFLV